MNCIPALVAGVKNIYLTTPALNSNVNPAIIYAAKKCGVKEIYKTGGAHSIAALAYGTKTFKKVNKIVGPGNAYVASAKKEVYGDVASYGCRTIRSKYRSGQICKSRMDCV